MARAQTRPLVRRVRRGGTVLDVGAGAGLRTAALAASGLRVIAVEPDAEERARLISWARAGVEVRAGGAPDMLGVAEADGALLWHVLEHVEDPRVTLAALVRALRPGAPVLIAVPNPVGAEATLLGGRWHGWEPARHRWHLPPDTLATLMRDAGLRDVSARARGGWGYASTLAFSLAPGLDPQLAAGRAAAAGTALAAALAPVALAARLAGRGPQVVASGRAPG